MCMNILQKMQLSIFIMRKDRKEINFKRRDYESVLGRQASLGWNSKKVRKKTSTVYRVNTSILILQLYWRLIP